MSADPSPAVNEARLPNPPQTLNWVVCVVVAAIALAFFWGQVPVRLKPVGLSSVLIGAAFGWATGRLAREFRVDVPALVGLLAAMAVIAGLAGSAVVAHRAGVVEMEAYAKKHPPQFDPIKERFEKMLAQPDEDLSLEERQNLEQARASHELGETLRREREEAHRERLTFSGYLNNRIPKEWGVWPAPCPTVFWVAELLLAGGLSGWLAVPRSHAITR